MEISNETYQYAAHPYVHWVLLSEKLCAVAVEFSFAWIDKTQTNMYCNRSLTVDHVRVWKTIRSFKRDIETITAIQ